MRNRKLQLMVVLTTILVLSACQTVENENAKTNLSTTETSESNNSTEQIISAEQYGTYSQKDLKVGTVEEATATIKLSGHSATVEGEGVTVKDGLVTITQAGIYAVSGQMTEGQLKVAANKESEDVRIVLNGATISNSKTTPLLVESADKVIISLAEGTTNVVNDTRQLKETADETEEDAALFSKEDLTINGPGRLEVTSTYNDGIRSKDDLVLISGTYKVEAANNGIKGKDSISILAGDYHVEADNDGFQTNNTESGKGWLAVDGGQFNLITGHDGLQAETELRVSEGTFDISSGGGVNGSQSETESFKGMKAGGGIQVNSGKVTIDSADDSLHTNGSLTIDGGEFQLKSGDDGIHADEALTINNGTVTVNESYEGLEAAHIKIEGGTISMTSSDDGLNAGGGSDSAAQGGFGKDNFSAAGDYSISINDGTVFVDAEGDGIDSNGDVAITGGTTLVSGPTNGGNGALDYEGEFVISGGILVAAGSSGMAMLPSESSSQASLGLYFDSSQEANQMLNLADSKGNNLITFAPKKPYQHVAISAPSIQLETEYHLSVGGEMTSESQFGFAAKSDYKGETLLTVTLDTVNTSVSQSGGAIMNNQMGVGPGGRGGGDNQPPK